METTRDDCSEYIVELVFGVHRNNFCEPAAIHHTMFCNALVYLSVIVLKSRNEEH